MSDGKKQKMSDDKKQKMSDDKKQKTTDIFEQLEELRRNPSCIALHRRVRDCIDTTGDWNKCQKQFDDLVDECYFQAEKREREAKKRGGK